jgi:hypothetical protein
VVDVNVVSTPSAAPSPGTAPEGAPHEADTERERDAGGVIPTGRIRIVRGAVHYERIVGRNINDFRIGRLNHDDALTLDDLRLNLLLFIRVQRAFVLSLLAHPLNGIHHIALLG